MMDEMERHETIHEYHARLSGPLFSNTKDLYKAGVAGTCKGKRGNACPSFSCFWYSPAGWTFSSDDPGSGG